MDNGYTLSDIATLLMNNGNGFLGGGGGGLTLLIVMFFLIMFLGGGGNFFGRNGITPEDLCNSNSFNDLKNSVGRNGDAIGTTSNVVQRGICDLGYETLRNFSMTQNQIHGVQDYLGTQIRGTQDVLGNLMVNLKTQLAECCCGIQRAIDGVNFNVERNAAGINRTTIEVGQKILDKMAEQDARAAAARQEAMQARINQLEFERSIDRATAGVVRYPTTTAYASNCNPFSWGGNSNCGCAYGNV